MSDQPYITSRSARFHSHLEQKENIVCFNLEPPLACNFQMCLISLLSHWDVAPPIRWPHCYLSAAGTYAGLMAPEQQLGLAAALGVGLGAS